MFTALQCLDKAVELEQRAAGDLPARARDDYIDMSREWRRLAARALIQDQRAMAAFQTPGA